ncbi:Prevent-host-death protein, partial [Candidatus Thiomargarita nelsonii]
MLVFFYKIYMQITISNGREVNIMQKYSITETHKNLSTLIHLIEETGTQIGITRGDKTVAVLAPKNERLKKSKLSPWEA